MQGRLPPLVVLVCAVAAVGLALLHAEELQDRASAALGRGMPEREAELARGFVLGQDEGIDAGTAEDFRRAGLAHLLAVSGQNVALLLLLAMPLLAALGMPLRTRLLWMLGLIAVYVPIAGAGPSIQRAGVMGALSVLATLEGRRASRFYALVIAAIVTLAIDPRIARDIGWQLSFAAVLGILALARPLREAFLGRGAATGGLKRALAEGAAMTVAATLTTAPLIAFHFGELSTTSLLANLLALPAVAPAMWLGMLAAAAGQLPGFPVEALNSLGAPLLAYIAEVAHWCAQPDWAQLRLELGMERLLGCYAALVVAILAALRLSAALRGALLRGAIGLTVALVAVGLGLARQEGAAAAPAGLRVTVLDIGQGDAILLQAPGTGPILVDGGPHGEGLAEDLSDAGVERLGAAVLTHDEADHAGGIEELLGRMPIDRLVYAAAGPELLSEARQAGARPLQLAAGGVVRAGELRLEALWPPATVRFPEAGTALDAGGTAADPNQDALVTLLHWRHFSMLLAADAEAESAPLDPGPLDVLKVAHHGSEDAGLAGLLAKSDPELAVISVGAGNFYGHPAPSTLATLIGHGIRVLRTDRDGTVTIEVDRDGIVVAGG